jgi:hypothetical protein
MTNHPNRNQKGKSPEFNMTVLLTGDRKNRRPFYTLKSARHYAKTVCNDKNVVRIVLTGPNVNVVMYEARAEV